MAPPGEGGEPLIRGVSVRRGPLEESHHRVHLAVTDAGGRLQAASGDPGRVVLLRSAAKPFQALPLVEDGLVGGAKGLTAAGLAVCCGSHSGEEGHLREVRGILERAGVSEEALECGPHPPLGEAAARALQERGWAPAPIHNNCSGKHAGMLLLARARGWPLRGYRLPGHPVQRRILQGMAGWAGVPPSQAVVAVDGCGVPTFGLPLHHAARAFAALGVAAREGEAGPRAVVAAMAEHPFMVGGSGRLCTRVMEEAGDRVVVKLGAEGVYGGLLRRGGLGFVLKVEDGARRACEVALVGLLEALGVLTAPELERLGEWRRPPVRNTRGEEVGWMEWVGDP